ncbi:MAG: rhomboid family intramembrane serine protease [Candidatus Kapabacteria bacterium]|nr:rhomboid family intramembrane serine protease [Ignavibacteriota bacterium]MCW5885266.1 rhomboid family intramembrane serine protease [Candidatus Kapabacteria bacterium]
MDISNTPSAIVIFIATISISLYTLYKNHRLLHAWILSPRRVYYDKQYHLVLTSGFLHADLMHLLFNMFTFFFFGFKLEAAIGTPNFLIIYFGSMILSVISTILKKKDDYNYGSLGASGAISGVVFASILIAPNSKLMIMPLPIPIPAYIFGVLYLLWSYFAAKKSLDMINHEAHFWGALAGVIFMIILIPGILSHFWYNIF